VHQRIVALARFHDDVAAFAAIAARGASARDKFLAPESDAAIAPVAGFHANCGFVDKHRQTSSSVMDGLPFDEPDGRPRLGIPQFRSFRPSPSSAE
jgi:hypothetical protein